MKSDAKTSRPLVYIMARPHCGSTMLSSLLGFSHELEGVGEVIVGLSKSKNVPCGCGEARDACAFWRTVRDRVEADGQMTWRHVLDVQQRQARLSRLPATLLARGGRRWVRECRLAVEALAEAIRAASGKPGVVDGSKERSRALFLGRFVPEARILHLVRHPCGIVNSFYWRNQKHGTFWFMRKVYRFPRPLFPLGVVVVALFWNVEMLIALTLALLMRRKLLRVRYEELCEDPETYLRRVGSFIDVDLSQVAAAARRGDEMPVGHNIGGSRMRLQGTFRLDPNAGQWRSRLPVLYRAITALLTWPLLPLAGYPIFRKKA